jgi:hypothetical protein
MPEFTSGGSGFGSNCDGGGAGGTSAATPPQIAMIATMP